jgi:hypothetical protein
MHLSQTNLNWGQKLQFLQKKVEKHFIYQNRYTQNLTNPWQSSLLLLILKFTNNGWTLLSNTVKNKIKFLSTFYQ